MMKKLSVILVEDHTLVRKGILMILEKAQNIDVVGEAENGRQAIKMVDKYRPNIVIMDIALPILNGIDATYQIKKKYPNISILILTMHIQSHYVFNLLKAGISGYILKNAVPDELLLGLNAISEGKKYFSPEISTEIVNNILHSKDDENKKNISGLLTIREREILQLLVEGYKNKEIGKMLYISIKTVEVHRTKIMRKLGTRNLAQLIKRAYNEGIIPP